MNIDKNKVFSDVIFASLIMNPKDSNEGSKKTAFNNEYKEMYCVKKIGLFHTIVKSEEDTHRRLYKYEIK